MTEPRETNLSKEFLDSVRALPDGDRIDQCIQCGTCTASCPTGAVMDYSPREVMAALRAGMIDRVLESNTVWLCASCYSCMVRCPAKIPFTDVMYELKRLGVEHKMVPPRTTNAVMAECFAKSVDKHGRNAETELVMNYYLRTNPWKLLSQSGLVMKLFKTGRLALLPHNIKGIDGLRRMLAAAEKDDNP